MVRRVVPSARRVSGRLLYVTPTAKQLGKNAKKSSIKGDKPGPDKLTQNSFLKSGEEQFFAFLVLHKEKEKEKNKGNPKKWETWNEPPSPQLY
jgi:hypothetical protein